MASALRAAEPAVRREVAASRRTWPLIVGGLPQVLPATLRGAVGAASASAAALPEPSFVVSARTLTGPAAGIGGIYESYERLTRQGWRLTDAALTTIASASPAASGASAAFSATRGQVRGVPAGPGTATAQASFARENSPLYVDAIYDGHFDLSLLGKGLVSGYERLGGPAAFGSTLTQGEVSALADAYSIPGVRLEPHPQGAAREG